MTQRTWTMWFVVDHVHDGDTIIGELDQGLGVHQRPISVRLAGIDTPELGTANGDVAQRFLAGLVPPGAVLRVDSVKWDKYAGRIDGIVRLPNDYTNVNDQMLVSGLALPYNGHGPRPWNPDGTRREATS